MSVSLSKKLLSLLLACAFLSPSLSAQASESSNSLSITLENPVQFEDPKGEEVLVSPGTYVVTAVEETLFLTGTESDNSISLQAEERSHQADIPAPAAASIPGEEGPLADSHIVILYFPDGHALQAIGTYQGIQSRSIPEDTELSGSPTSITFEKAVHFMAPDGNPVVTSPGEYTAEAVQDWIRLTPGEDRQNALLVEAQKGTNDLDVEELMALSLPGSTEKELDLHHVMLLLPTGHTLEATGSYSGIQPRGFFKKTFNKAKKTASRTYRKARSGGRKTASTIRKGTRHATLKARQAVLKAKRAAERAARVAAAKAIAISKKGVAFAKVLTCKITVRAIRTSKNLGGLLKNTLPTGNHLQKHTEGRIKNDAAFRKHITQLATTKLKAHKQVVAEMKRISSFLNNPKNKATLDQVFSPKSFCQDSISTTNKKLERLGLIPNFSKVRSRGTDDTDFYVGWQMTVSGGVGGGGQVGLLVVSSNSGGGKYWFAGPQSITNFSIGASYELAFFPKVPLASFEGWGAGIAFSAGPPTQVVSGTVNVKFDAKFKKFLGFGISVDVGVGVLPADVAVSWSHNTKYSSKRPTFAN